jgi:Cft2 family RNA processing exonuclease
MLNLCEKLNFGQEYKSRGIKLIPYSSGFSIGSCMWFLQSERMK